ncbi:unnamed protein product [Penicillium salamii]|nr:unnamed protein product [Penicillium salamii]CAG8210205.1 unnamed protein product [Penicillium salamii]
MRGVIGRACRHNVASMMKMRSAFSLGESTTYNLNIPPLYRPPLREFLETTPACLPNFGD